MRTIDDYLALIPAANRPQPNFVAFVSALLDGFVDVQNTAAGMPDDFDIDNAVGKQLDAIGVRVGLSRNLPIPISGVYFSLDTPGLGLDQGVVRGPFDPTDALTALDDTTYRFALHIKIAANSWNGSLEDAQTMLSAMANPGTYIFMQDNFDMTLSIGVSGIVPSVLFVALLQQMGEWIRPGGVASSVYETSVSGAPLFGLDMQNSYVAGLDTGTVGIKY